MTKCFTNNLKSPSTQICPDLLELHLDVGASLCLMMYVQSLTLEGCFHIHLPNEERLSQLVLNMSLRRVPSSMICDITTTLEPIVIQYATYSSVIWKHLASSTYTLEMKHAYSLDFFKEGEIDVLYRFSGNSK